MTAKQFKEKQLNDIKCLLNKEKSKLVQAALRNDLRMLEAEIKIIEGSSYEKAYGIEDWKWERLLLAYVFWPLF